MGFIRKRKFPNVERAMKQHLLRQSPTCALCGKLIRDMKHASIDHIIPVSRGGQTTIDNCRVAHTWCNKIRGAKPDPLREPDERVGAGDQQTAHDPGAE